MESILRKDVDLFLNGAVDDYVVFNDPKPKFVDIFTKETKFIHVMAET